MKATARDVAMGLLSAPLSDGAATQMLAGFATKDLHLRLVAAFEELRRTNSYFEFETRDTGDTELLVSIHHPVSCSVRIVLLEQAILLSREPQELVGRLCEGTADTDAVVLVLCADAMNVSVPPVVDEVFRVAGRQRGVVVVVEPSWAASILIERRPALLSPHGNIRHSDMHMSESGKSDLARSEAVLVRRVRDRSRVTFGAILEDSGQYAEQVRALEEEPVPDGPILLCTTYLHPCTHSERAVQRYYNDAGAERSFSLLVNKKTRLERELWFRHVSQHQRIDVLDRNEIEAYFLAPEYYQMRLNRDELREQINNLQAMLQNQNYSICLCPEAVNLCFEIRGREVYIRSDRRNKGPSQAGRIHGLLLHDPRMSETFEREFWSLYRATEESFKEKQAVATWLESLFEKFVQTTP